MIQGVSEVSSTVLSVVQPSRSSGVTKPISEEPHVPTPKTPSRETVALENSDNSLVTKSLEEVVAEVQESIKKVEPRVQLSVDEDLNRVVVKVVDGDSGELIRQIPSEEVLRIQRFFSEHFGILVEEEA